MKTKIDIISGFLGAGKTTFIKKLVTEAYMDERVVVIENEFGKVNIDGTVLKDSGVIVEELAAGCICCSLYGDFSISIKEVIKKYKPDRIIIEPTGIALLTEILSSLNELEKLNLIKINLVLTIVDVNRFKFTMLCSKEFIENQIKVTKSIILNKTSGVDEVLIQEVVQQLLQVNPDANIIKMEWDNVTAKEIINAAMNKDKYYQNKGKTRNIKGRKLNNAPLTLKGGSFNKNIMGFRNSSEKFSSCEFEINTTFNKQKLEEIFHRLQNEAEYGKILRGKGILRDINDKWFKFDYVPGELSYENYSTSYLGKACIIGMNLNKENISKLFLDN
jgi:G3E family GTPase